MSRTFYQFQTNNYLHNIAMAINLLMLKFEI